MSNISIVYASVHHNNTKKVVDYLKANLDDVELFKSTDIEEPNLNETKYLILASGIYFGNLHRSILNYIEKTNLENVNVIVVYTCGMHYKNFLKKVKRILEEKKANYLGDAYSKGYDTYGILKSIGGISKNHPNDEDLNKILTSIKSLIKQ